jgi:hypothetical protein
MVHGVLVLIWRFVNALEDAATSVAQRQAKKSMVTHAETQFHNMIGLKSKG